MTIYILTAYDLKTQYFVERSFFTSKSKALKSKDYLIDYLTKNHSLNSSENFKSNDSIILDNWFNVTLVEDTTKTKVLKYV